MCRIRINLYRAPDIISEIRKGISRCLGHVQRTPKERILKKVFNNIPEGKMFVGKPRKRWMDEDENDLKKMAVKEYG